MFTHNQVLRRFGVGLLVSMALAPFVRAQSTVDEAMDALVTRIYATMSEEELYALDDAKVQALLTPDERRVLATKHWYFDVDAPVIVSVLRHVEQKVVPFWLEESGFRKTGLTAENLEGWVYEIWQKAFPAGRVELGINGFDKHRPHYLVGVGAQEPGAKVTVSNTHPADQVIEELKPGALTYYDWTELVLTEVPIELQGQLLLPTSRGRSVEAAVVGAFRKTTFPSSTTPSPVYLTWSENPKTTQTVQWRTITAVVDGVVRYRERGADTFNEVAATYKAMQDRMLANDRYCHWFSAVLRGLEPGKTYEYRVGSSALDVWSEIAEFRTAPEDPESFKFLYCSDTHSNEIWGNVQKATFQRHPDAAFCVISGDLVRTGMERNDWDEFLVHGEPVFKSVPVMPTIGNHDAQYGFPPAMYLDIFGLPEHGPERLEPERVYTFSYGNTQFFMLDVMSDRVPQRDWLKAELEKSEATWKIAVFHFPFYTAEAEYPHLHEAWGTLFDQHHVDLVLTGHVHTHLRTAPMRAGKKMDSAAEGTVYVQTVSIPSRPARAEKPDFVDAWVGGGAFCNVIEVGRNTLRFQTYNAEGEVKDEFVLEK